MVVGQLARAGFASREPAAAGSGERTVYALTDAGRDELRDWLPSWWRSRHSTRSSAPVADPGAAASRRSACCARLDHLGRQQARSAP
jgi:DNA-binding PadR family transcriptional regulator